jgi:TonB family protein
MALMVARVGWGQIDAKAIEHGLKGKPMGLRSYSAEAVARYEWKGDKLVAVPGHMFTLGVFTTRSVKLKGKTLIFEGSRGTLVRDTQANRFVRMGEAPMRLEVDLHNAPAALQSATLEKMLFVGDVAEAIAGLPMPLSEMLPLNTAGVAGCNCVRVFDGGQWIKLASKDPHFSFPKLTFSVEPEFTEEARQKKIAGDVTVIIYINSAGHVEDIWIAIPLGSGLDEKAAMAARQYVFDPAMYEGRPVGTVLSVGISFQIF